MKLLAIDCMLIAGGHVTFANTATSTSSVAIIDVSITISHHERASFHCIIHPVASISSSASPDTQPDMLTGNQSLLHAAANAVHYDRAVVTARAHRSTSARPRTIQAVRRAAQATAADAGTGTDDAFSFALEWRCTYDGFKRVGQHHVFDIR